MLKIYYLLTLCLLFGQNQYAIGQTKSDKPNIIFILTDDQRWDALGHAGNPIIQTPNMDDLAKDGTYFENAFVTTPICAASRASFITGMYERSHGFTFGTKPLQEKYINHTYPKLLKENGYHTGFIGKFGMRFEKKLDTTLFDYYSRPGEKFWAITYYRLTPDHTGHRHLSSIIGTESLDFLQEYADDGPFCLTVSFHAPHAEDVSPQQYIYPVELDSLYQDNIIPEPNLGEQKYFDEQPTWVKEGLNKIRWYWRFKNEEQYQHMVKAYYRMVTGVDNEIGKIRKKLEELGIADNTVIILMGDNGYFLGERKLAGKWLMYDNSLRVPLIVYDPRLANGKNLDNLVLNIDIAPTILSYAGVKIPEMMQGDNLLKLMNAENSPWRNSFFCEHLFENKKIPKSEGIRTTDWKYFRYVDHPEWEELYYLKNDQLETINLAQEKSSLPTLNKLRQKLDKYISDSNSRK